MSELDPAAWRAALRERLSAGLQTAFSIDDGLLAAFEGGSAATGRADEYSDIDLNIVARGQVHPSLFDCVERLVREVGAITHLWHNAELPWPGTVQRFYFIEGAPRFFVLDCVLLVPEAAPELLEVERHGNAQVLFDRAGCLQPRQLDRAAHGRRMARRLAQMDGSRPLYRMLVDKELARARPLDAFGFYLALLRMNVELAGMLHRPDRFDFGWRYLHVDLPESLAAELQSVTCGADLQQIGSHLPLVDQLHGQLRAQVERAGLSPSVD